MIKRIFSKLKDEKGLSLFEILIVTAIVSGAAIAIISTVTTGSDKVKKNNAKAKLAEIAGYVKMYKSEKGKYPDELVDLVDAEFYEEEPEDPWGNEFIYNKPGEGGRKYEICTDGPDDETEDDDFCNWTKEDDEDDE